MARGQALGCGGAMEHAARDGSPGRGPRRGPSPGIGTSSAPRVLLDALDPGAARAAAAVVRLVGGEVVGDVPRGSVRAAQGGPGRHPAHPPGPTPTPVPAHGPGPAGGGVDLVLTGDPIRVTPDRIGDVPGVVVGERGSLRLPGDEDLLADVVHAVVMQRSRVRGSVAPSGEAVPAPVGSTPGGPVPGGGRCPSGGGRGAAGRGPGPGGDPGEPRGLVVAVAGWQGGAGTTTLVRALAHHVGAIAVDATGAGPGLVAPGEEGLPGVRWADLRVSEPSPHPDLVSRLPVMGAGPALVADHRGGATPSDPRLAPVLRHLSHAGDVVVDLGRWDGRGAALTGLAASGDAPAVRGVVDVVCLVGGGDDESAVRLAGVVGVWPPLCPLVVVHTRRAPSPLLVGAVVGVGPDVSGRADGAADEGGGDGVVTWHFSRGGRGRGASRRLSLLWSRMRRLVPEACVPAGGNGGVSGGGCVP